MEILQEIQLLYNSTTIHLLTQALLLSFELAAGILLTSLCAGTFLAIIKTYLGKIFGQLVTIYVEIFRNTPDFVLDLRVLYRASIRESVCESSRRHVFRLDGNHL